MREDIKFRYVVEHDATHEIRYYYYTLDEIECANYYELAKVDNTIRWDLIGRDQWTGLKDKNDKDIYENDVLLTDALEAIVFWDNQAACFKLDFQFDQEMLCQHQLQNIEIISNRYEFPVKE